MGVARGEPRAGEGQEANTQESQHGALGLMPGAGWLLVVVPLKSSRNLWW